MVAQNIGFAIIAAMMVVGALRVVTTSNVVHAALWLEKHGDITRADAFKRRAEKQSKIQRQSASHI